MRELDEFLRVSSLNMDNSSQNTPDNSTLAVSENMTRVMTVATPAVK